MTQHQTHTAVELGDPIWQQAFDDKRIRKDFVAKVFSILGIQLFVASALIAWFIFDDSTRQYMQINGAPLQIIAMIATIILWIMMSCFESMRRTFPINIIVLGLLTLSYGLATAIFSARFTSGTVFCAFVSTAFATLLIISMAKFSPYDLTKCGWFMCLLPIFHLIIAIILILTVPLRYASTTSLILGSMGAFCVTLYMLYDLQLIMGGRTYELSPEEYIFAAAALYIDILMMFRYMLLLFKN